MWYRYGHVKTVLVILWILNSAVTDNTICPYNLEYSTPLTLIQKELVTLNGSIKTLRIFDPLMGNQIVIPSASEWYLDPLRRLGIRVIGTEEGGTFFVALDAIDDKGRNVIVRAYQYIEPLEGVITVKNSMTYFDRLRENFRSTDGIVKYDCIYFYENIVFMIRPKFDYTLRERLLASPILEDIEKLWIAFQVITSVTSLHQISLVHGSLHPDNVFVDWDAKVSITDMAPYKPTHIHEGRTHVFHHFFETSSRNSCYLAPEQIILSKDYDESDVFGHQSIAADLFSVGCVIYYIYTGNHMFTFSTLSQYAAGAYDITKQISEIPRSVQSLVSGLLSRDVNVRHDISSDFKSFFHQGFTQIKTQFSVFSKDTTSHSKFFELFPVFTAIADNSDPGLRLILANSFIPFIMASTMVSEIIKFSFFLVDFVEPLDDDIVATRILPVYIQLLSYPNDLLKITALRCVNQIITRLKKVTNKDIVTVFILNALENKSKTFSPNFKACLYELTPNIVAQISRIDPSFGKVTMLMHPLLEEEDPMLIDAFRRGIEAVSDIEGIEPSLYFPFILTSYNHSLHPSKICLLNAFKVFYEKGIINDSFLTDIARAVVGFARSAQPETLEGLLMFLQWYVDTCTYEESFYSDVLDVSLTYLHSSSDCIRSLSRSLLKIVPAKYIQGIMPCVEDSIPDYVQSEPKALFTLPSPFIKVPNQQMLEKTKRKFISSRRPTRYGVLAASYIPSTDLCLAGSDSGQILLGSDRRNFSELMNFSGVPVTSISPINNHSCFVASGSGEITILDIETQTLLTKDKVSGHLVAKAINNQFLIASNDGLINLFDVRTDRAKECLRFQNTQISSLCSWPDGFLYGVGSKEGFISVFDIRTFKTIYQYASNPIYSLEVFPTEYPTVSISTKENVLLYDLQNRKSIAEIPVSNVVQSKVDDKIVFANEGVACILSYCNELLLHVLSSDGSVYPLLPDNSPYSGINQSEPFLLQPLHQHYTSVSCISQDSGRIVTGDTLGFVNFWCL